MDPQHDGVSTIRVTDVDLAANQSVVLPISELEVPTTPTTPASPSKLLELVYRRRDSFDDSMVPERIRYDPLDVTSLSEESGKGAVPSAKPVHLRVEDVSYSVFKGTGQSRIEKKILQNINLSVQPGQFMAILGSSGAGKTTLLNLLAGRVTNGGEAQSTGHILVNGQKRNYRDFRQMSAYVLQEDTLFATLTVEETINLSALLRLPKDMSREEKLKRANDVIIELGLQKCRHTYVGNEIVRGVSGGERKRVNIGVELVSDPSLLFLDEPTSGLDSYNAQNVVLTLLKLAQSNRTIIATIHQPRSSIYQMFDLLFLLSEGKQMYFGPASEATTYFDKIGYHCPRSFNPADYFVDLISSDTRSAEKESVTKERIQYLADKFQAHWKSNRPQIEYKSERDAFNSTIVSETDKSSYSDFASSWITQLRLLATRSLRLMPRNKPQNIAQAGQTIIFSLLLGFIWLNEGKLTTGDSVRSIVAVLFFILVNQSFVVTFGIIFTFPSERSIILRERASRTYQVSSYFLSKTASEFPRTAMFCMCFCLATYFMVDLRSGAEYFFEYFVIVFLTQLCAEGLAYVVSALALDAQQAGAIAPVFIVTSMLFGGFFINADSIPVWLSWLRYVSFLRYGFGAIMQNQFQDRVLDITCNANGFCPPDGEAVLREYDVDGISFAVNMILMLVFAAGFRALAYLVLRYLRGPRYNRSM